MQVFATLIKRNLRIFRHASFPDCSMFPICKILTFPTTCVFVNFPSNYLGCRGLRPNSHGCFSSRRALAGRLSCTKLPRARRRRFHRRSRATTTSATTADVRTHAHTESTDMTTTRTIRTAAAWWLWRRRRGGCGRGGGGGGQKKLVGHRIYWLIHSKSGHWLAIVKLK